jgi:hypothetical protein
MSSDASPIDLRKAAAEYVSGDLDPAESAAFAELAAADPALAGETAFWRTLHGGLAPTPVDPAWAPGRSFRNAIWQRLDWERAAQRAPRPVTIPLPRWLGATVAAGLGVTIGWWTASHGAATAPVATAARPAQQPVAYQDDGGALVSPAAQNVTWTRYMPYGSLSKIDTSLPRAADQQSPPAMKPWLGVWTKPIELDSHGTLRGHGHLVLRVASSGPVAAAGIHPGDVILSLDHCPVMTPHCIADHLVNASPGDELVVEYWSAQTATVSEIKVTLGCVCE